MDLFSSGALRTCSNLTRVIPRALGLPSPGIPLPDEKGKDSISIPQVAVPYDTQGSLPLRYHYHRKKKRGDYDYESIYRDLQDAENLAENGKEKVTESPNDTQNPLNNQDDYSEDYGWESDTDSPDPEPYKAFLQDYDLTKSPAQKRKNNQENPNLKWDDLLEVVYREGLIFVSKPITMKLANSVISLMIYLDQEHKHDRHSTMLINSTGGSMLGGLAIYDTMNIVRGKPMTINIGMAASMASLVLAGGGLRASFPHAKVMIHQPRMTAFEDDSSEIAFEARVLLELRRNITEIYVRKTERTFMCITRDMEIDKFMTATEARDYGIIDEIIPKGTREKTLSDRVFRSL